MKKQDMEPTKQDKQKKINMGGDQPSFTMADVGSESKTEDVKEKEKRLYSYQISPIASRSDRLLPAASPSKERPRPPADLRGQRRDTHKTDIDNGTNRALLQAALARGRWPPHVALVWALALLLTHALHALAALLATALPPAKKLCSSLRSWTEEAWLQLDTSRVYPIVLGFLTVASYVLYLAMYALYSVTLWTIEPLYPELDAASYDNDVTVTDYDDLEVKLSDKS